MKKVFIWLQQWILRHRKKLAYGVLTLLIGQICFFGLGGIGIENEVFAAGDETQTQSQSIESVVTEKFQTLSYIQKIIYTLIYPFLVIAGTLVDNSLVYGAVFHFDVVLRKLWNIMRNFANFTLGFIFIYKIFMYLIGDKKSKDLKDFLIRLLIAGIGIQASWFAMATLIDLSTILTYGIGGLPMTILNDKDSQEEGKGNSYDPYILATIVDIDVKDIDKKRTYLTNTKGTHVYISECSTVNVQGHELLLAPSMIYYKDVSEVNPKPTINSGCHYGGQVYYFSSLYSGMAYTKPLSGDYKNEQIIYESKLATVIGDITSNLSGDDVKGLIAAGSLLEKGDAHGTGGIWGALRTGHYTQDQQRGLDVDNKWTANAGGGSERLHELGTNDSYVGVFRQLYSSLMAAGDTIIVKEGSEFTKLLGVALSLGHLIAIGIPLIVAAVVFMIRIGILWVAIVISPFIVILTAFNDIGEKVYKNVKFLEYFKIEELIGIIFSPVFVCLAISLSTVFVTVISKLGTLPNGGGMRDILGGAIKLNVDGITADIGRFVIAIVGVAITWFLVRAAVESSKIGKGGIVTGLKKLAETSLGSIPIVPIPGKGGKGVEFVGASTAFGLNGKQSILSRVNTDFKSKFSDDKAMDEWLNSDEARKTAEENANKNKIKQYMDGLNNATLSGDWINDYYVTTIDADGKQVTTRFNNLSESDKEAVLNKINGLDDAKRKDFYNNTKNKQIRVNNKDRVFEAQDNGKDVYKFKEKTSSQPTTPTTPTTTTP